jgi:hypothetical protein
MVAYACPVSDLRYLSSEASCFDKGMLSMNRQEWRLAEPTAAVERVIKSPDPTKLGLLFAISPDSFLQDGKITFKNSIDGSVQQQLVFTGCTNNWPGSRQHLLPVYVPLSSCTVSVDFDASATVNRGFNAVVLPSDKDALEYFAEVSRSHVARLNVPPIHFSGWLSPERGYATSYRTTDDAENGFGRHSSFDEFHARLSSIGVQSVVIESSHDGSCPSNSWETVNFVGLKRVAVVFDRRTTSHYVQLVTPTLGKEIRYRIGQPFLRFVESSNSEFARYPCTVDNPALIGCGCFDVHVLSVQNETLDDVDADTWGYRMLFFNADVLNRVWASEIRLDSSSSVKVLEKSLDGLFYKIDTGVTLIGDGSHRVGDTLQLFEENYEKIRERMDELFARSNTFARSVESDIITAFNADEEGERKQQQAHKNEDDMGAEETKDDEDERGKSNAGTDLSYDTYPKSKGRASAFSAARGADISDFYSSELESAAEGHDDEDHHFEEDAHPHFDYIHGDVSDSILSGAPHLSDSCLWLRRTEFREVVSSSVDFILLQPAPGLSGCYQFRVDPETFKLSAGEFVRLINLEDNRTIMDIAPTDKLIYCSHDGPLKMEFCVTDNNKRIAWKKLPSDVNPRADPKQIEGTGTVIEKEFDASNVQIVFGPDAASYRSGSYKVDDEYSWESFDSPPAVIRCSSKVTINFDNGGTKYRCFWDEEKFLDIPAKVVDGPDSIFSYFQNRTDEVQTIIFDANVVDYCEFSIQSENVADSFIQLGCSAGGGVAAGQVCRTIGNGTLEFSVDGIRGQTPRLWTNKKFENSISQGLCFQSGSIIGIAVEYNQNDDVTAFRFTLNGQSLGFPPLELPGDHAWQPAFSFSPGQRVSINLGQGKFAFHPTPSQKISLAGNGFRTWNDTLGFWESVDLTSHACLFEDPISEVVTAYARELDTVWTSVHNPPQMKGSPTASRRKRLSTGIARSFTGVSLLSHSATGPGVTDIKQTAVQAITAVVTSLGSKTSIESVTLTARNPKQDLSVLVQIGYAGLEEVFAEAVKARFKESGASYASNKLEGNPGMLFKTPNTSLAVDEVPLSAQIEDLAVAEMLGYRDGSLCKRLDKVLTSVGTKGTPWLSREQLATELSGAVIAVAASDVEAEFSSRTVDTALLVAENLVLALEKESIPVVRMEHDRNVLNSMLSEFSEYMIPGKFGIIESGHNGYHGGSSVEAQFGLPGVSKIAILFDRHTDMFSKDHVSFVSEQTYTESQFSQAEHYNPTKEKSFFPRKTANGVTPLVLNCGGNLRILWKSGKRKDKNAAKFGFRCILFDARLLGRTIADSIELADSVQMFSKLVNYGITSVRSGVELVRVKQVVKFFRNWAYTVSKDTFTTAKMTLPKMKSFFKHKKQELKETVALRASVLEKIHGGVEEVDEDELVDEAELLDVYATADHAATLANIQQTFIYLGVVELCCELLIQYKDHDAFMHGIHLGNYIMMNLNVKAQSNFFECIDKRDRAALGAISRKLSTFKRDIGSSVGIDRECKLRDTIVILSFLQTLCDGQFRQLQLCMTDKFSGESSGKTLVENVVDILVDSYAMILVSDLNNTDDLKLYFDVAQQCMDTLTDFMQGPVASNQDACLETQLLEYLMKWIEYSDAIRLDFLKDLEDDNQLPQLKFTWNAKFSKIFEVKGASRHGFYKSTAAAKVWPLIEDINEVERSALNLVSNLLDNVRVHSEEDDSVENHAARFSKVLPTLAIYSDALIHRFKVVWASVVFDGKASYDKYQGQLEKAERKRRKREAGGIVEIAKGDSFKKKMSRILTIINDDTNLSFKPSNLKLEEAEKQMYMKVWLLFDDEDYDSAISSAFAYYQLFSFISGQFVEAEFTKGLSPEAIISLQRINEMWEGRDDGALISRDEAFAFDNYFVSIEVVINDKLVRFYFPIPRYCREQVKNPLVIEEMDNAIQSVDRDSAESKLNNFLDLALEVENVILQQDRVNRSSVLLRFVTANNDIWVAVMGSLTLVLNVVLLLFVNGTSDPENDMMPHEVLVHVRRIGYAHFAMSLVMLTNFLLGRTLVNVNSGFKWKSLVVEDVVALPVDSRALLAVFKIADDLVPRAVWTLFFVLYDTKTLYYIASAACSALGCWVNAAFFSFHVLDITVRIQLLGYVLKSVFQNGSQVVVTFVLGAALTWIYAVIGIYCFGYNTYSYGDSPGDYSWPETLRAAYWQHLDFGLRGPPIFNDYSTYQQAGKYIFDISYQVSKRRPVFFIVFDT